MRYAEPCHLTAAERFAEIADVLARGALRLAARRALLRSSLECDANPLDVEGRSKAPCPTGATHSQREEPAA